MGGRGSSSMSGGSPPAPAPATPRQQAAISAWTGGGWMAIRESQLAGRDSADARAIEGFIDASEKWGDFMPTFRGMNLGPSDYRRFAQVGAVLEPGSLQSWTTDGSLATEFSQFWKAGNPVILRSRTQRRGTGIKHLSHRPDENEVLVSKRARYRVESVTEDYGGLGITVIDVEEF